MANTVTPRRDDPALFAALTAEKDSLIKRDNEIAECLKEFQVKGDGVSQLSDGDTARKKELYQDQNSVALRMKSVREQLSELNNPANAERKVSADDLPASTRFLMGGISRLSAEEQKDFCNDLPYKQQNAHGMRICAADLAQTGSASPLEPRQILDGALGGTPMMAAPTTSLIGKPAVAKPVLPGLLRRLKGYGDAPGLMRQRISERGEQTTESYTDPTTVTGEVFYNADRFEATVDNPNAFKAVTLYAHKFTSGRVQVQRDTFRDVTAFNVDAAVRAEINDVVGRLLNKQVVKTQTGTNAPRGLVNVAIDSDETAANNTFKASELTAMQHKIDFAYRRPGPEGYMGYMNDVGTGAIAYMVSDDALRIIKTMEDNQNRPLYLPSVREDVPDVWNGHMMFVNAELDDVSAGANKYPVLFGNFGYSVFRLISDMTIFRFYDSATAQHDVVEYILWGRFDAAPLAVNQDTRDANTKSDAFVRLKKKA